VNPLKNCCRSFALAALLLAGPANAQSLLTGSSWSGPYWGLTGGGAWADVKNASKSSDLNFSGHMGYGLQISSLYFGGEVDAAWGGSSATTNISALYSSSLSVDWSASARARAGFTVAGALLYVTAGTAWSGQTFGVHSLGRELSTSTKTGPGLVYGAGIEMKVLPNLSARIEALHYDFSSQDARFRDALPSSIAGTARKGIDLDETVVRAGLTLRFN
jgi:outer membrane immunogenic protein